MDMMILGETIRSNVDGTTFLGFWMPARGNDGVGAIETFLVNGTGFTVKMQTKTSDATDAGAADIGSASIGTTLGITKFDVTNAKDLVRYVIVGPANQYMHFQFLQPQWAPN
jgi:hypothetical protein